MTHENIGEVRPDMAIDENLPQIHITGIALPRREFQRALNRTVKRELKKRMKRKNGRKNHSGE